THTLRGAHVMIADAVLTGGAKTRTPLLLRSFGGSMRRIAHLLKVLALGLLRLGSSAVAQRLTMAHGANPGTLDPSRTFNGLSVSSTHQVSETRVYFGTDGVTQPRWAESWELTQPNVLEVMIREGATFPGRTPRDAAAVVASLEHSRDPDATNRGRV